MQYLLQLFLKKWSQKPAEIRVDFWQVGGECWKHFMCRIDKAWSTMTQWLPGVSYYCKSNKTNDWDSNSAVFKANDLTWSFWFFYSTTFHDFRRIFKFLVKQDLSCQLRPHEMVMTTSDHFASQFHVAKLCWLVQLFLVFGPKHLLYFGGLAQA